MTCERKADAYPCKDSEKLFDVEQVLPISTTVSPDSTEVTTPALGPATDSSEEESNEEKETSTEEPESSTEEGESSEESKTEAVTNGPFDSLLTTGLSEESGAGSATTSVPSETDDADKETGATTMEEYKECMKKSAALRMVSGD